LDFFKNIKIICFEHIEMSERRELTDFERGAVYGLWKAESIQ
jgi:hypothetical protein